MLEYDLHRKLKIFNKKLNSVYKTNAPLYQVEDSWDNFKWIAVDERDNNVVSFSRTDKQGNQIIAIINFSGYDFPKYNIGADKGVYKVVLCTEDKRFGGRGIVKRKTYKTVRKSAHGKEYSIGVRLPRLSGMLLVKCIND